MWICLNNAFFSIVIDREIPGNLLVRARDATSIPNVFGSDAKMVVTPRNDYRYRTSLPRQVVAGVIYSAMSDINYDNFKDSVKDRRLHDAYVDVWGTMYAYQENKASWG